MHWIKTSTIVKNENQKSFPSCLSKPCNLSKEIQQIYLRVEVWGLSCIYSWRKEHMLDFDLWSCWSSILCKCWSRGRSCNWTVSKNIKNWQNRCVRWCNFDDDDNVGKNNLENNHVKTSQMLIKGQKLQLDCKKMKGTFKSWSSNLEVIYTV